MLKKLLSSVLILAMIITFTAGCTATPQANSALVQTAAVAGTLVTQRAPKYIFMFIGDGMSAVQVNSAQIFGGNNEHNNMSLDEMNFQEFEAVGYQTTHDATSFAPDSASTATALSSGFKTWSGTLGLKPVGVVSGNKPVNVDPDDVPMTIAERLKKEKGMKIGIISTVTINHATPAAYYAHVPSRNDYYDIAMQMADSGFDYFGGGTISQPTGKDNDKPDAYGILKEKGYNIVNTKEDILALNNKSGKVYAVTPKVQDGGAMPYAIDTEAGDLTLADFVEKGIDVLYNTNKGFFMMTESGKIDWAGHANDAMANIGDVIAFEDAIQVAIDFAKKHPKDTLIIVTGDHETGGMTIGQATTGYDTAFDILKNQKMSYVEFDKLIGDMIKKDTDVFTFDEVMPVITENFGLVNLVDGDINDKKAEKSTYMTLELSDYEVSRLEDALEETLKEGSTEKSFEETSLIYGGYTPLSVTLTHILNSKAGIGWTSYSHTGVPVPVYATGVNAHLFNGAYDNTEIYDKLVQITKLK
ncbi:alkaline phosphatase [Gudongella oleilytica]|uniref:alkaline phosphatase n=1 Tax=Gudongella oleilytica TaxID=1582259 RepID=UPI000FF8B3F9|nr:alkaline phosphatase [Gudongella oleilytica]